MSVADKKVAVIGLGYVGLPLAALCAKKDDFIHPKVSSTRLRFRWLIS